MPMMANVTLVFCEKETLWIYNDQTLIYHLNYNHVDIGITQHFHPRLAALSKSASCMMTWTPSLCSLRPTARLDYT
jgi:hypothetical protein